MFFLKISTPRRRSLLHRPPPSNRPIRRLPFWFFQRLLRAFFLLIALLSFIYVVFKSNFFWIAEVETFFEGRGFDTEPVRNFVTSQLVGRHILFLDEKKLSEETRRKFLSVAEIRTELNLPNKIAVYIIQREPVAKLLFDFETSSDLAIIQSLAKEATSSSERILVDDSGLLFFRGLRPELPLLAIGGGQGSLGQSLSARSEKLMIEMILLMRSAELPVLFVTQERGDILMVLRDQTIIWATEEKEASDLVEVTRMVFEKYRIEAKKLAKIDLRFKNPVVEFRQPQ